MHQALLSLATTTTYVSDQEPAATWYLSLFNRGWPEDPAISGKKIGAHTPMSDVARIGADPDLCDLLPLPVILAPRV
jgi:hypothetical protein